MSVLFHTPTTRRTAMAKKQKNEEDDMVIIRWTWEDVQSLRPELSKDECLELLDRIGGSLADRSIELGWEVMQILVSMEG
jgi:hypothetical protein